MGVGMTTPTRDECIDQAAQTYIDGLATRDSMTAEDAARAAGARTPEQVAALASRIRDARQPDSKTA